MRTLVTVLASAFVLSGCAFAKQQANLAPTVSVVESTQGQGMTVAVRVVDERPSKSLGRRGSAYGAAAEITAVQEVAVVVQQQVVDGLKKKGFTIIDYAPGQPRNLTVEVRFLDYSTSQGMFTGGVNIRGALKASAQRDGQTYEQLYRSDKEERVVVVPTAKTNEQWINTALSEVLQQLFNDQGLMTFLAQ